MSGGCIVDLQIGVGYRLHLCALRMLTEVEGLTMATATGLDRGRMRWGTGTSLCLALPNSFDCKRLLVKLCNLDPLQLRQGTHTSVTGQ